MKKISSLHILLIIFWFLITKKNNTQSKSNTQSKPPDLIRNTFHLPYFSKVHPMLMWALALIPMYLFFANEKHQHQLPMIFEHMLVVYISIIAVQTFKLFINPQNQVIDYKFTLLTLLILNLLMYDIIPKNQSVLAYMYVLGFKYIEFMKNESHTTSQTIDSFVLTHLMFFLLK